MNGMFSIWKSDSGFDFGFSKIYMMDDIIYKYKKQLCMFSENYNRSISGKLWPSNLAVNT